MQKRVLALIPRGKPDHLIKDTGTFRSHIDLRPALSFFDGIATIKERYPPTFIRIGSGPERRLVEFENEADQHFLVQRVAAFGHYAEANLTLANAATEMCNQFPGLAELGNPKVVLPSEFTDFFQDTRHTVVCEFIDGLSIAPRNASLEDIFHFKEKRNEEYQAFWEVLEEVATDPIETIINQSKQKLDRLKNALSEYETVSSECWGRRICNTAQLRFTLDGTTIASLLSAAALQAKLNLEPLVIAAGALGAVRFSIDLLPAHPDLSKTSSAMSYVQRVKHL